MIKSDGEMNIKVVVDDSKPEEKNMQTGSLSDAKRFSSLRHLLHHLHLELCLIHRQKISMLLE